MLKRRCGKCHDSLRDKRAQKRYKWSNNGSESLDGYSSGLPLMMGVVIDVGELGRSTALKLNSLNSL